MHEQLTKKIVARRQLATAIELFFAAKDPISIYSLAANAWEVIDALCAAAGIESMSAQARAYVPTGKDLKAHYVNSPYRNFFKHADWDPDQVLEPLPQSHLEGLLFFAVEDYIRLNGRSPVHFQLFQLWYLAKHPEKFDPAVGDDLVQSVANAFPDLPKLDQAGQVALGAKHLFDALQDLKLLRDPRTESAFE